MAIYNQLPIYKDSYQLLLEIYQVTSKFSREHKYNLGQDMRRDALAMMRHLYGANINIEHRQEYIDRFLNMFEMLKVEIRLCVDMNIMSINRLAHISLIMDSIAKQARAWRARSGQKQ